MSHEPGEAGYDDRRADIDKNTPADPRKIVTCPDCGKKFSTGGGTIGGGTGASSAAGGGGG